MNLNISREYIALKPRLHIRVMREAWCITHHASLPWRHIMDFPGYHPKSLHVIQGQPRVDPFVDYIVFFSYLCC